MQQLDSDTRASELLPLCSKTSLANLIENFLVYTEKINLGYILVMP